MSHNILLPICHLLLVASVFRSNVRSPLLCWQNIFTVAWRKYNREQFVDKQLKTFCSSDHLPLFLVYMAFLFCTQKASLKMHHVLALSTLFIFGCQLEHF